MKNKLAIRVEVGDILRGANKEGRDRSERAIGAAFGKAVVDAAYFAGRLEGVQISRNKEHTWLYITGLVTLGVWDKPEIEECRAVLLQIAPRLKQALANWPQGRFFLEAADGSREPLDC